jgi:high-affinity nickel permease
MDATLFATVAALSLGVGGTIGVLGAALALGVRHGIDWDHIAAITDITSTAAGQAEEDETWLSREPGLMLTDESHHHRRVAAPVALAAAVAVGAPAAHVHSLGELAHRHNGRFAPGKIDRFVRRQRPALVLGTMYALGHGTMVVVLGLLALLARQFLPDWIDPIMERVVGATLILLAAYLIYSVVQFFRGGGEFQLRSRWMLVFAGARNAFGLVRSKLLGRPHEHVHEAQQYGVKTAYAVGLIHGIGAETGTQVLVIATAVGAGSKGMGSAALAAFVVGLLISNSIVTVVSTAGFVSTRRRQGIYVAAGIVAAIFSLFVGVFFLFARGGLLPDLGHYFRWIGGPS